MKIIEPIRRRVSRLLTAPKEELGHLARFVRFQIQLWRFCARRLRANNATAMSAALSFRTIFALVPVIVLVLVMAKTLGKLENSKQVLHSFLAEGGLSQIAYAQEPATKPATETEGADEEESSTQISLAETVESLIEKVEKQLTLGRLGPIGAAVLIWTALTLLTTIERSLNRIFEAPRSRSIARRTLLYWSALTLGPLLLIAAAVAGRRLLDLAHMVPGVSWLLAPIGWLGPILVGLALLASLYCLLPNTRVSLRRALEGALVAVPVWLLARWAFALYVARVGSQSLYGALGLIPLFLLWLNVSWLIFLFGAEVAHTTANLARMQSAENSKQRLLGPWDLLAVVVTLARENIATGMPVGTERISELLQLPDVATENLLNRLAQQRLVCPAGPAENGAYLLARPADRIAVTDVLRVGRADTEQPPGESVAAGQLVERLRRRVEAGIENVSLQQVVANNDV